MDDFITQIRKHVLERMDLSREMTDQEIENLIGEETSQVLQGSSVSIAERMQLEQRVFNSLRKT